MNPLTELLQSKHSRSGFSCGKEQLDDYLHHQANQDVKRKLAVCFVCHNPTTLDIKGYYTLSTLSIPLEHIPETFRKKLPPSYRSIPVILLGRLAIDQRHQGQGLGKLLLIDALHRCHEVAKNIGAFAVITDPLDQAAELFYAKYGFLKLPASGKMFIAMKTVSSLFE